MVAEFVDNDTSASKVRGAGTQWAAMLDAIKRDEFDVVIAVDLDRLLRTTSDLVTLIDLNAQVVTVDGEIDLSTADGEFRATMLAGIARFEVRRKGERQKRANEARAAQGKPNPGRRRYGFESDGATVREDEAEVVRDVFRRAHEGLSIRSITQHLKDNVTVTTGTAWTTRRVRDMLNNPAYAGMTIYKGEAIPSEHMPVIVDPEVAAEVRAILADPARKTAPTNEPKYLLSGVARCGVCGAAMYYMRGYLCRESAGHVHIKREFLDDRVRDAVLNAVLWAPTPERDVSGSLALREELNELRRQKGVAQELALLPGADMTHVRRTLTRLTSKEDKLQGQLDALVASNAVAAIEETVSEFRDLAVQVGIVGFETPAEDVWKLKQSADALNARWDSLEVEKQRALVAYFLQVTVMPGRTADRIRIQTRR